jgi:hypothetical protein
MAVERKTTFLNLIDRIIILEKGGKARSDDVFRKIMMEYFFQRECEEKKVLALLKSFDLPVFFESKNSLLDLDHEQFTTFIKGNMTNNSFPGQILLSKQYLKSFHPNYPSELSKMPPDEQMEILTEVKDKIARIIAAFDKMREDIEADKQRTVLTLVALIFRNIHIRTGIAFTNLERLASDIINEVFKGSESVFIASPEQCAELSDDRNIKALIKEFCVIRKNRDLAEIADLFKKEFERYKIRAQYAFGTSGK